MSTIEKMLEAAQNSDAMHAAAQATVQATNAHPDWIVGAIIAAVATMGGYFAFRAVSR